MNNISGKRCALAWGRINENSFLYRFNLVLLIELLASTNEHLSDFPVFEQVLYKINFHSRSLMLTGLLLKVFSIIFKILFLE